METFEYAIKKDVRNNPIVREVDAARERQMWGWIRMSLLALAVGLFYAWQHWEVRQHGYAVVDLERELAKQEVEGRQLLLRLEELRSPRHLEEEARRRLDMISPGPGDAIVIERVQPADLPAPSVVASR